MTDPGRIILCSGMPRSASTLQYQLAIRAAELTGPTRSCGWYDGEPLIQILESIPAGETWVYKVHRYASSYRFEEAVATGRVLGLTTQRDVRAVVASYRQLHDRSMWWVARHRVLEGMMDDYRAWSRAKNVLAQSYDELTTSTCESFSAIAAHLGVAVDPDTARSSVSDLGRGSQAEKTATLRKESAGTARPNDLLQSGHVGPHERTIQPDFHTAWVESVAASWLRAHGNELITARTMRVIARLCYSPRWLWFLRWHVESRTLGSALTRRARFARSWARHLRFRAGSLPLVVRRLLARLNAHYRPGPIVDRATTVVIVAWNSAGIIDDTLRIVRAFSPSDTRVIVVDNASDDNTIGIAHRHPNVRVIALDENVGHGPAMDLGFLAARTEFCVALDVDAFPIRPGWIETMRQRLDDGATVAGAEWTRAIGLYIHPCCLMMRRATFVEKRHSFEPRFLPGVNPTGHLGQRYWDAGERISMREGAANLAPFPMTSSTEFMIGMVFGDLVYHNGATSRAADSDTWSDSGGAERALAVWREAVARFEPAPVDLERSIELDRAGAIGALRGSME